MCLFDMTQKGLAIIHPLPLFLVCKLYHMYVLFVWWCHFQQYFSYIVAVSFIGGGPGENHLPVASQTLSHNVVQLDWSRFELTTSLVIGINCIGSCKSNYHMIMSMTGPSHVCKKHFLSISHVCTMYKKKHVIDWHLIFYLLFLSPDASSKGTIEMGVVRPSVCPQLVSRW